MSRTELREEWEGRLAEFESSGQTATAWCAEQGINIHRLRYWSSKLRENRRKPSNGEVRWLSVEMESVIKPSSNEALTVQVGQARIEVSEGFNAKLFIQVVQALANAHP
uniref:IS66 family insertion sequence element accessory protein TnpA n=1 Tax=Alicyclobacillus suci TaxID=2816080 RepID=UPI001A900754